jgi:hypothetical protein
MWMDGGTIRKIGPTPEIVSAYEAAMTSGNANSCMDRNVKARFLKWEITDPPSESPHMLKSLDPVTVRISLQVNHPVLRGHHGIALFNTDRQLMWAWAKDDIQLEPGVHSFTYAFPMLPLRPGAYFWQASLWEDKELLEIWDFTPEMNIAAPVHQHTRDEWNGVLNVPCVFAIRNGEGASVAARTTF